MRGVFVGVMLVGAAMAAPAPAASADICAVPSAMTLSGTVRDLHSMREEPQAEIETWFHLELATPVCGKKSVTASVIGLIPCVNGDAVTVTGRFQPPSKMFDTASIHAERAEIRCTAAKDD